MQTTPEPLNHDQVRQERVAIAPERHMKREECS